MNLEERLYNCFKKIFDKYNGKLKIPLDCSGIVYDTAGYECSDEFLGEMYQLWLKENDDKGVES